MADAGERGQAAGMDFSARLGDACWLRFWWESRLSGHGSMSTVQLESVIHLENLAGLPPVAFVPLRKHCDMIAIRSRCLGSRD
jgi:hypothetical protein